MARYLCVYTLDARAWFYHLVWTCAIQTFVRALNLRLICQSLESSSGGTAAPPRAPHLAADRLTCEAD